MTIYFMDTSALAKRYLIEVGSAQIREFTTASNVIIIAEIATVEMFSLINRQLRESTIAPEVAEKLKNQFLWHAAHEYLAISGQTAVYAAARELLNRHPLRTLDALQLASALEAVRILEEPLTFVASDLRLLSAARSERLETIQPA